MKLIKHLLLLNVLVAGFALAQGDRPSNAAIKSDMGVILTAYKTLKDQVNDGTQNASSLTLVQTMIDRSISSKAEVPARADAQGLQGEARAAFLDGYQSQMQKLIDKLGELKAALEAGNNPAATSLFNEIRPIQGDGHAQYK